MNHPTLRREIDDLLTCNSRDVEGIYEKALNIFLRYTAPGSTFSFRAVEVAGEAHYDALRYRATEESYEEFSASISGAPILRGPTMDVFQPSTDELNRFKIVSMVGPAFEGTPLHEHFLAPFGFVSCFRIMIYRDRRFTGWLGTFRTADHPPFEPGLAQAFQPLVAPLTVAYSVAEQFSRCGWQDEKMAILTSTGHLDFASPDLRDNLDADSLRRLADMIRGLESGDVTQCVRVVDGVEVRMSRVEGGGIFRYIAQFTPAKPVLLEPLSRLTPAQREVAILAARGHTAPEIAERLDRSPNTIKVHLRELYRRLGVSSRVELTTLIGE